MRPIFAHGIESCNLTDSFSEDFGLRSDLNTGSSFDQIQSPEVSNLLVDHVTQNGALYLSADEIEQDVYS